MNYCVFEIDLTDATKVRCENCGRRMHVVEGMPLDRYRATCGGGGPGLARKAANFAKAVARDVRAGRPRRSAEEVARIIAVCESNECGLYDAARGRCTHKDCGCPVRRKAPYKMERCPEGYWS